MNDLRQELYFLLQDVKTVLKEEKQTLFFARAEEKAFFIKPPIPTSVSTQTPVPSSQPLPVQKVDPIKKPVIEKKQNILQEPIFKAPLIKEEIIAPTQVIEEKTIVQKPQEKLLEQTTIKEKKFSLIKEMDIQFFQNLFSKIAPEISLILELPDDTEAKKVLKQYAQKNKISEIILFYENEKNEEKEFLEKLAAAISSHFSECMLKNLQDLKNGKQLEDYLDSPSLKWVVIQEKTLQTNPLLWGFYKKETEQKHQLKEKNLFLIPDIEHYLKNPSLKASLWQSLKQTFSSFKAFS